MPAYNTTPWITPVRMIQEPQLPNYSFGSKNSEVADGRFLISNTALTANVATYTVQIVEGNIPVAGQIVSVVGSTNNAAFNVAQKAIASVGSFNASGVGTFTVAITHANVTSAPDKGVVYASVPETADAVSAASQSGLQFSVSRMQHRQQGSNFAWAYAFPSAPAAVTSIALQGAINDVDAEYSNLDSQSTVVLAAGGETRPVTLPENVNFVRVKFAGASGGTLPTVVAKILG